MINYLKGIVIQVNKLTNNRYILILEVQEIAFEIQITSHFSQQLQSDCTNLVRIYTHLQIKEDGPHLFGFATSAERDIFRQLIAINSIGVQLANALIDSLGIEKLVQAIVTEKVAILVKVPGVGNKTAERLILELKGKLAQHYVTTNISLNNLSPANSIFPELEATLLALGYEDLEIASAIDRLSLDKQLMQSQELEQWLRRVITELS